MNRTSILAAALVAVVASTAFTHAADYVPYTGAGDPDGLISRDLDLMSTGSVSPINYVPYTGFGDPAGLISRRIDPTSTGSVSGKRGSQVPYTGFGDPDDLV